eukprot:NODE_817_length_3942_cov_0.627374.p3 type:complete len:101 gc:universal NODE_817_length_3942_cov_0.627374:3510-3208(-)
MFLATLLDKLLIIWLVLNNGKYIRSCLCMLYLLIISLDLTYSGLHLFIPFAICEKEEYRVFKLLEKSGKVMQLYKNTYKFVINDIFKKTIELLVIFNGVF